MEIIEEYGQSINGNSLYDFNKFYVIMKLFKVTKCLSSMIKNKTGQRQWTTANKQEDKTGLKHSKILQSPERG